MLWSMIFVTATALYWFKILFQNSWVKSMTHHHDNLPKQIPVTAPLLIGLIFTGCKVRAKPLSMKKKQLRAKLIRESFCSLQITCSLYFQFLRLETLKIVNMCVDWKSLTLNLTDWARNWQTSTNPPAEVSLR